MYHRSPWISCIVAVAGLDKHDILAAFESRVGNSLDVELSTALAQVMRIAQLRLEHLGDPAHK